MNRRSLIILVTGGALGWTGATVVNDGDGNGDDAPPAADGNSETDAPPRSTETVSSPTGTAQPTATAEPTPEASPTATQTPEPTTTPDPSLRRNIDVYSRGFEDDSSYKVLYSLRNENDARVAVSFEATVTLRNGDTLMKQETATIDPGQGVNSEFVFEGYDSSPTGWGFQLRDVEAA